MHNIVMRTNSTPRHSGDTPVVLYDLPQLSLSPKETISAQYQIIDIILYLSVKLNLMKVWSPASITVNLKSKMHWSNPNTSHTSQDQLLNPKTLKYATEIH